MFKYQVSLEAHIKAHHTKEHKCPKCNKFFTYTSSLTNHIKQCHEAHPPLRHTCMYCGKKFNTKTECIEHELMHKIRKFNCDTCDKKFESKKQLLSHNKIHRPFVCDICGLGFRKSFSLKNHINRHLKTKNSGSFVLMVDMKEDQDATEKSQEIIGAEQTVLEHQFTTEDGIQIGLDNTISENYIDIGNGNYLKIQGNTVNIDGTDYILLPEDGKSTDQVQMVVDETYTENQLPVVDNLHNNVMLVDSDNQIILNENQEAEYVFTTDSTIKQNAYIISDQFV